MRERNRRAREYSRRCRLLRWRRRLWVVAIILWVALAAAIIWTMTRSAPEAAPPVLPPVTAEVLDVADKPAETLLICDVTGYCACCTPYAHMNQRDGKVLTASGLWVNIGEAVAVDPDIIPLGSTVTLGGKTSATGDSGAASATGKYCVAMTIGPCGRVMGDIGNAIVCVERRDSGEIAAILAGIVDGETLKPGVWYTVKDGQWSEVKE